MENDFSAIKSIQELKNLLDSGAITPQEYDVLKRKIIFGNSAPGNGAVPLTPPVAPGTGESRNIVPPPPPIRETPPVATENKPVTPEYRRTPQPEPVAPVADTPEKTNYTLFGESGVEQSDAPQEKSRDWLLTILISLAAVLLIGLVAYWLISDKDSERLTSTSGPDTEEVMPATGPTTNTETKPEAVTTESTDPGAIATTPTPENLPANAETPGAVVPPTTDANQPAEATPPVQATAPAQPAPTPRTTDEEAVNKIKDRLQAYYNDIKTAPFAAQNHFAPNVERYYTLIGTTPQAISENINSYHFTEFQDSESEIEDGTIKLTNSGENGFEVTYIEHGKAFRKSKGQKQETTARVRARFDKDFKITFFRQEQLLENKFFD